MFFSVVFKLQSYRMSCLTVLLCPGLHSTQQAVMWPQLRLSFGNAGDAKWPELNCITLIKIRTLVEIFSQKQPGKWKQNKPFLFVGLTFYWCVKINYFFFHVSNLRFGFAHASCHMAMLQVLVTVAKPCQMFFSPNRSARWDSFKDLFSQRLTTERFKVWAWKGKAKQSNAGEPANPLAPQQECVLCSLSFVLRRGWGPAEHTWWPNTCKVGVFPSLSSAGRWQKKEQMQSRFKVDSLFRCVFWFLVVACSSIDVL